MAYDFLKKLFGTPKEGEAPKAMTYAELEAAIDGDKDISLVNLKAGGYVSKDKFDAKDTELKGVQAQLTSANEQIKSFEGQDIEGIKAKVSLVAPKSIARSEGKAVRVIDNRKI